MKKLPVWLQLVVGMLAVAGVLLIVQGSLEFIRETQYEANQTKVSAQLTEICIVPVPTLNPGWIAEGEFIYQQRCAACHGANLEGAPNWKEKNADGSNPPPPLNNDGHAFHHSDAGLLKIIREGLGEGKQSSMPAFVDILNESEILAVMEYIKSTWKPGVQTHQHAISLSIREAWSRPALEGDVGVVYLFIDNPTTRTDMLTGARTDVAERVELHTTTISEDDVAHMEHAGMWMIPTQSSLELTPGGMHLMLVNLRQALQVGQTFWVTLQFENAGEMSVLVEVRR